MRGIKCIRAVLLVSLFILGWNFPGFAQSGETLTITTYYPSPYGSYREINIHGKETFKDSGASPQDLELSTDGAGDLVLNVATNPDPLSPAQIYFNDSGTIRPFTYLQDFNSSGGPTYCATGYLVVNFLNADKTPADSSSLPSTGYYVCLRGWE